MSAVRIYLRGPFSPYSGYGRDLIGLAEALVRAGVDLYIQPNHVSPPLPPLIAGLLTRELEAPFDVTIEHVDPFILNLQDSTRVNSTLTAGWTMWEHTKLVPLGEGQKLKNLEHNWKNFDTIFVYDEVSRQALEPFAELYDDLKLTILQGGYDPRLWKRVDRDWHSERLGLIMIGALSPRKAPMDFIQAFRQLKDEYPDDVKGLRASLKTNVPGLHPAMMDWCPDMKIFYDNWPTDVVNTFYEANHVLFAPSWGEGKNLPALEFMTTGGVVAASDFGGHQGWMSSEYAYPLAGDVVDNMPREHPGCKSFRVRRESLMETMIHMYRNRDELKHKADLASRIIPATMSWDAKVNKFFEKLAENHPEKGKEILMRYQMGKRDAPTLPGE